MNVCLKQISWYEANRSDFSVWSWVLQHNSWDQSVLHCCHISLRKWHSRQNLFLMNRSNLWDFRASSFRGLTFVLFCLKIMNERRIHLCLYRIIWRLFLSRGPIFCFELFGDFIVLVVNHRMVIMEISIEEQGAWVFCRILPQLLLQLHWGTFWSQHQWFCRRYCSWNKMNSSRNLIWWSLFLWI